MENSYSLKFSQLLEIFFTDNKIDQKKYSKFCNTFHSVNQKIWQTEFYSEQVLNIFDQTEFSKKYLQVINSDSTGSKDSVPWTSTQTKTEIKKDELRSDANLYLDGFLSSASGTLDSFLHEINIIYQIIPSKKDIYLDRFLAEIEKKNLKNLEIYQYLASFSKKRKWTYFKKLRNKSSHESVLVDSIHYISKAQGEVLDYILLPDDPKAWPYKYSKRIKLDIFIRDMNVFFQDLMKHLYKKSIHDLEKSKQIPIR